MISDNSEASFGPLVCGVATEPDCELAKILQHLSRIVSDTGDRCIRFLNDKEHDDLLAYGPFLARNLLETACTAFVGRIDPYRLISIKRFQEHQDYDVSMRHKISLQWRGDVISAEKPPANRWGNDGAAKATARALLSDYWGDVFWTPAFSRFMDAEIEGSSIIGDLRRIEPENAVAYFRSEADKLYSSLSKGIHPEFVGRSRYAEKNSPTR